MNRDFIIGYISGMIDGEGNIFFRGHGTTKKSARTIVSISNTDIGIINHCCIFLKQLNIKHRVYKSIRKKGWKPVYVIWIESQGNMIKLFKHINIYSKSKNDEMLKIINWVKRKKSKYNVREIKDMYFNKNMSMLQIAKHYNLKGGGGHIYRLITKDGTILRKKWAKTK